MFLRRRRPFAIAATLLLGLTLLAGLTPGTSAVETRPDAAASAVDWLASQQLDNGGFPGFSGEADPSTTADAVMAIAATGVDPATIQRAGGLSAVDYLRSHAADAAASPGAASKLILALHAAEGNAFDPSNVEDVDLIAAIARSFNTESGAYGEGLYVHAYALLALSASNAPIANTAGATLINAQIEDGSWSFSGDTSPGGGDSNTTSIVLMALAANGLGQAAIEAGLAYLASVQAPDGSFAYDGSADPLVGDSNSTALAVQAHIAVGRDPAKLSGGNAVAALAAFQLPSGALTWMLDSPDDSMFATVQGIPALVGDALPVSHLGAPPIAPDLESALLPATGLGDDGCRYFVVTFHNVCGPFALYWEANGGLKIFGYPLTEVFVEDGLEVQYFERTRLEHHPLLWPENFNILQGRLGAEQLGIGD